MLATSPMAWETKSGDCRRRLLDTEEAAPPVTVTVVGLTIVVEAPWASVIVALISNVPSGRMKFRVPNSCPSERSFHTASDLETSFE